MTKYLFQGSDPRAATCRGKLQSKRSKLNLEINKELMLRSGAENLFKWVFKIIWLPYSILPPSVFPQIGFCGCCCCSCFFNTDFRYLNWLANLQLKMLFDINENVSRGPLVVTFAESFFAKDFTNKIIMLTSWNLQSFNKQEDEGDGRAGAELRELEPAVVEGAARGAQQLGWALSDAEQLWGEKKLRKSWGKVEEKLRKSWEKV